MIKIRKFIETDAREASTVIRSALQEINSKDYSDSVIQFLYNEFSPERMVDLSKEKDFFIAERSGDLVGTITLINIYIGMVFVDPNHLNHGIGSGLMVFIEDLARKKGLINLTLQASITALGFYERLKYKKIKKNHDDSYGITYEMRKELN